MFNFTRSQRNGLIVLSFLIVVSALFPLFIDYFEENNSSSFKEFEAVINNARKKEIIAEPKAKENPIEAYNFNPNLVSKQGLEQLGLDKKQVNQILNYREKNGVFYTKEDFHNIYAIDDETYFRLESFIDIPKRKYPKSKKDSQTGQKVIKKEAPVFIDLNTVSELELQKVKGIGAFFSRSIIEHRNALGGFIDKNQLKEIFGMDEEKFQKIESQIFVGGQDVQKIRINYDTANELEKHPYFSAKLSKSILKNRTFNGRYKSLKDLQLRLDLEDSFIEKIKPYIEI